MTNYNERLDEILTELDQGGYLGEGGVYTARTAITSLITELVEEAKPKDYVDYYENDPIERGRKISYDEAVREFEQNLLKALEEV